MVRGFISASSTVQVKFLLECTIGKYFTILGRQSAGLTRLDRFSHRIEGDKRDRDLHRRR